MPNNSSHDPNRPPAAPHISTVRSALREAVASATELVDLLAAGLTADDQQRRAVTGSRAVPGGLAPTPPATDSNHIVDSKHSNDSNDGGHR